MTLHTQYKILRFFITKTIRRKGKNARDKLNETETSRIGFVHLRDRSWSLGTPSYSQHLWRKRIQKILNQTMPPFTGNVSLLTRIDPKRVTITIKTWMMSKVFEGTDNIRDNSSNVCDWTHEKRETMKDSHLLDSSFSTAPTHHVRLSKPPTHERAQKGRRRM